MMYVSFSGVQGSGKSTLANIVYDYLISRYDNKYKIIKSSSVTRKLLVSLNIYLYELRKNKEALKVWQYFALKEHFEQLNKLSKKYDIIIMDRCYIDFLVYTDMFLHKNYLDKLVSIFKDDIYDFENQSIEFYLEPLHNKDKIDDGIRDISCYELEIKKFNEYIWMFDEVIEQDTVYNRADKVISILNKRL